jgi:hypothetical protein
MPTRDSRREDYILRILRQAGEALRRLRERLTASADSAQSVRQEARAEIAQVLGDQAAMLGLVDADTASRLIGKRDRVELWADLLQLEADACDASGDARAAAALRTRTAGLRAAATKLPE